MSDVALQQMMADNFTENAQQVEEVQQSEVEVIEGVHTSQEEKPSPSPAVSPTPLQEH
jgi:hypothetical protein